MPNAYCGRLLLPDILPPSGRLDFIIGEPCIAGGG